MQAVIEHVLPKASKHFQLIQTLVRWAPLLGLFKQLRQTT